MANHTINAAPALGAGQIFSGAHSLFFKNFVPIFLACFIPQLVVFVASYALGLYSGVALIQVDPWAYFRSWQLWTSVLLGFLSTATILILMFHTLGDLVTKVQPSLSKYIQHLTSMSMLFLLIYSFLIFFVLAFFAILVAVLFFSAPVLVALLGLLLLISLWLYLVGLTAAVTPSAILERTGFGSFGRSAFLTKGYRWSACGTLILAVLPITAVNYVINNIIASGTILGDPANLEQNALLTGILGLFTTPLFMGIGSTATMLIFVRLRQIKEGFNVSNVDEIFS